MNYDQLPALIENGFDWGRSTVYALLYEGVTFDSSQSRLSELGKPFRREMIQGRFVTDEGNLAGNSVVFYTIVPDTEYQLVIGWDDGTHDELLLGFYDTTQGGDPLQVQRAGSLIIRPLAEDGESIPHYGLWLLP